MAYDYCRKDDERREVLGDGGSFGLFSPWNLVESAEHIFSKKKDLIETLTGRVCIQLIAEDFFLQSTFQVDGFQMPRAPEPQLGSAVPVR